MNTWSRRMADGFRIYAALVWKEWREQRGVFALMALAAALMPEGVGWMKSGREILWQLAHYLWIVFALILGAGIFTNDASARANEFLGTQPLKGGRVWLAKMGFGMVALVVLVQLSAAMTHLKLMAEGSFWWRYFPQQYYEAVGGGGRRLAEFFVLTDALLPIVIFLLASMLGSMLSRALETFVVSLIFCGGWVAVNQVFGGKTPTRHTDFDYPGLRLIFIPLAVGLSLLVCSRLVFPLPARKWWRKLAAALVGAAAACAAAGLFAGGAVWLSERVPSLCRVYYVISFPRRSDGGASLQPGGGMAAVCVGSDWWSPRIWLVNTDGSGYRRISPGFSEYAGHGPWSADGQDLVYVTHSRPDSPLSWTDQPRAMLYDTKTGGSRALPFKLPPQDGYESTHMRFCGKDGRIFFCGEERMGLYFPDGRLIEDHPGTILQTGWAHFGEFPSKENGPRGWMNLSTGQVLDLPDEVINISSSGRWAVIAKRSAKPSNSVNALVLWNAQDRSLTPIAGGAENGAPSPASCHSEFSPDERFLAVQYEIPRTGGHGPGPLVVFDLKVRREAVRREDVGSLPPPSFSPDGRRLVYGREAATQLKAQPWLSICYVADLDTGEDIVVRARDQILETCWSLDGTKIALTSLWQPAPAKLFVFDTATKETREIPLRAPAAYAWPAGWVDEGTVLLATRDLYGGSVLWSARADGTEVRRLFP